MLRSLGSIFGVLLALALLALWLGGHLATVRDSVGQYKRNQLMAMGFTVQRIDVTGEGRLIEADVRAAMGIYEGDYFFGADLKRAQERVESLPWVDHALVRRLWPNRVVVHLVEETPYALYQQDGIIHLTDSEGVIVAPLTSETSRLPENLKLFIGQDAATHATTISTTVQSYPNIWSKTEALTRHASGRWDLTLTDGTFVRLPRENITQSLRRLTALEARLGDRYAIVDLRLNDRLTLTPREAKAT
jgi:cell division protein FtsQ